jgi:3-phenylpropionate/trans-cinnamate dioxygenase ferredoxin reductase subunit
MKGTERTFVIVGAGLAGAKAAESLRGWGFDGRVVLIGDEPVRPYERPPLSKAYMRGTATFEDAAVHPGAFYADHDIDLRCSTVVDAIDPVGRTLSLNPGGKLPFDQLLLATGARARPLDVPGSDLPGVTCLRTASDADAIRTAARPGARVVIVGAGWLGTEVAASLRELDVDVALIDRSAVPFQRSLGGEVGAVFLALHAEHGVAMHPGLTVTAVRGSTAVEEVELSDGTILPADLIVVGLGAVPNTGLASAAGIAVHDGILVDEELRTSTPGIFAAGDVANVEYPVFGSRARVAHWWTALTQGPVAAANMVGNHARCDWIPVFTSKQYDLLVEYTGHAPRWDRVVFRGDPATRQFVAFWLDEGRVVAGMTANVAGLAGPIRDLVASRQPAKPAQLADPGVDLVALAQAAAAPPGRSGQGAHTQGEEHQHSGSGAISEGLRQWYESCPCCMSQALPDVKQALDEEMAFSTAAAHTSRST